MPELPKLILRRCEGWHQLQMCPRVPDAHVGIGYHQIDIVFFPKGLPNKRQCYLLVNLTPSNVFRILHIEL
jgi:hypothetical protein